MKFNVDETSLGAAYSNACEALLLSVSKNVISRVLDIGIIATTTILNAVKSTEVPVAAKIKNANGDMIIAAIVEYFPNNDDPSRVGNWGYVWTFNESDIPDNATIIDPMDVKFESFFRVCSIERFCITIKDATYYHNIFATAFKVLKAHLLDNANPNEEYVLELKANNSTIAQFRAAVEDDEKIISVELDGETKQLIKDDAAIEK